MCIPLTMIIQLKFFDTEIDSIRFFDEGSQKTIKQVKEVKLVPASDVLFTDAEIEEIKTKAAALLENNANPGN